MKTTVNRRTIALGAPATLALSAIGSVVPLPATASSEIAPTTDFEASVQLFIKFYYMQFKTFSMYAAVFHLSKLLNGMTTPEKLLGNRTATAYLYMRLSAAQKISLANAVKVTIESQKFTAPTAPKREFNYNTLISWRSWFYNLTSAQITALKVHQAPIWGLAVSFTKIAAPSNEYDNLVARGNAASIAHTQRFLSWWSDPDTIVNEANDTVSIRLGKNRKPVERFPLIKDFESEWASDYEGPIYTEQSKALNGTTSFANETIESLYPARDGAMYSVKSDNYTTSLNQLEAMKYYVDEDIKRNGVFLNMTSLESRERLLSVTKYFFKESGEPYYGYLLAQLLIRASCQASVAATRAALFAKTIDLNVIQDYLKNAVDSTLDSTHLGGLMAKYSKTAITVISGLVAANCMLSILAFYKSKEVANENPIATQANEVLVQKVRDKMNTALDFAIANTVTSGLALGALTGVTISNSWNSNPYGRFAVPGFFGVADVTGGITEILGVFLNRPRNNTIYSNAEVGRICAGGIRATGGVYQLYESFGVITSWTFRGVMPPVREYPALAVTTMTATFTAMAYALAAIGL